MDRRPKYSHVRSKIDCGRSPRPCLSVKPKSIVPIDCAGIDELQPLEDAAKAEEDRKEAWSLRQSLYEREQSTAYLEPDVQQRSSNDHANENNSSDEIQIQYTKKLRNSINSFTDQLDSAQADHEEQISRVRSELDTTIESLKTTLQEKDSDLVFKSTEIRELKQELESSRVARENLLKTLAEISKTHNEDIEDLSSSIKKLVQRNQELHNENNTLHNQLRQVGFASDSNALELRSWQSLAKKYEVDIKSLNETNVQLLKDASELKCEVQMLTSDVEKKNTLLEQLATPTPVSIDNSSTVTVPHISVECQTEDVAVELNHPIPNVDELNMKTKENEEKLKIVAATNSELTVKLHERELALALAEESKTALKQEVENFESIVKLLREKCAEADATIQEHKSSLLQLKISHRKQLRELEEMVSKKEDSLLKVTSELEEHKLLTKSLDDKQNIIIEKQQELSDARNNNDKLLRQIEQQNLTNLRLKEAALLFEEMANENEVAFKKKCSELRELQVISEKQVADILRFNQDVSKVQLEHKKAISQLEDLRSQIAFLQRKSSNLTTKNMELELEISQANATNRKQTNEITILEEKVSLMATEHEACLAANKKLRVESSARFTEQCMTESRSDRLHQELEASRKECRELKEVLSREREANTKAAKLANLKEKELLESLADATDLCDQLRRRETELVSRPKKTLKEKLFGGDKRAKETEKYQYSIPTIPKTIEFKQPLRPEIGHPQPITVVNSASRDKENQNPESETDDDDTTDYSTTTMDSR